MREVFQSIVDAVSGAWWSYFVVFGVAMVDAFFPLVPSETVAITAGVLAGSGDLSLPLAILAASAGAFAGDNICYGLGTWLGEHTVKRFFRDEKSHKGFQWAERMLTTRGTYIIIIARFIPGGRTVTTFSAGYIPTFPYFRFVRADAVAAVIWGSYTVLLGYVGGKTFEDAPWKGLLFAFAVALGVTGSVELVRWLKRRRNPSAPERPAAAEEEGGA